MKTVLYADFSGRMFAHSVFFPSSPCISEMWFNAKPITSGMNSF